MFTMSFGGNSGSNCVAADTSACQREPPPLPLSAAIEPLPSINKIQFSLGPGGELASGDTVSIGVPS